MTGWRDRVEEFAVLPCGRVYLEIEVVGYLFTVIYRMPSNPKLALNPKAQIFKPYVGSSLNYGPFLGPQYSTAPL